MWRLVVFETSVILLIYTEEPLYNDSICPLRFGLLKEICHDKESQNIAVW